MRLEKKHYLKVFGKSTNKNVGLHAVKACERVVVKLHTFLNSALDGGECLVYAPVAITSRKTLLVPIA
jgi:hypothetical protein